MSHVGLFSRVKNLQQPAAAKVRRRGNQSELLIMMSHMVSWTATSSMCSKIAIQDLVIKVSLCRVPAVAKKI